MEKHPLLENMLARTAVVMGAVAVGTDMVNVTPAYAHEASPNRVAATSILPSTTTSHVRVDAPLNVADIPLPVVFVERTVTTTTGSLQPYERSFVAGSVSAADVEPIATTVKKDEIVPMVYSCNVTFQGGSSAEDATQNSVAGMTTPSTANETLATDRGENAEEAFRELPGMGDVQTTVLPGVEQSFSNEQIQQLKKVANEQGYGTVADMVVAFDAGRGDAAVRQALESLTQAREVRYTITCDGLVPVPPPYRSRETENGPTDDGDTPIAPAAPQQTAEHHYALHTDDILAGASIALTAAATVLSARRASPGEPSQPIPDEIAGEEVAEDEEDSKVLVGASNI